MCREARALEQDDGTVSCRSLAQQDGKKMFALIRTARQWVLSVLCRGKYADVPFISESVYLQVDASM